MIDRITVGAASLMGGLIAGTGLVRWAVAPPRARGRHRAARVVVLDEVVLEERLPPWQPVQPVCPQAWRYCPSCCRDEPSLLHADGSHTCGHCFRTTTKEG